MTIKQDEVGRSTVILTLAGRLDAVSTPMLERKLKQIRDDVTSLILDFAELTYISSMGLRVLLQAKKTFKGGERKFAIQNMGESVREVFEMTGFLKLMVQEERFVAIRKDEPDCIMLSLNGQMLEEDVQTVLQELLAIKEQKSQRQITKEKILTEDVSKMLEQGPNAVGPFTVILDMEKLTNLSPGAGSQLGKAISDTASDKRTLRIRNASKEVLEELERNGLGGFVG